MRAWQNPVWTCPLFGRSSKESGIFKEDIFFLRNFVVSWAKYKGDRKRMRKHLWADSGEPQIAGSQAEIAIPRKHGKGQPLKSSFLVWGPWRWYSPAAHCPIPWRESHSWLHPTLPHDRDLWPPNCSCRCWKHSGSLSAQMQLTVLWLQWPHCWRNGKKMYFAQWLLLC